MKLRILILSQYFPPEVGATQTRLHSFAAGLADQGHEVEVVCEIPNHPQGKVREGFRGRVALRRRMDGFRVTYVWVRTAPDKTTLTRLAFYGSYAALATAAGSAIRRPDVVFASSPPLPVAAAAALVAARHGVPWVMDVRDLWPDAAVAVGELSSPHMVRLAEWLERRLYRSAAAVTVVTEPFRRAVSGKLAEGEKVHVLPNGTTRLWVEGARLPPDRGALELPEERFLWTFAGNVGIAQGLDTAIAAAALLGDGFRLLILGDGPARRRLEHKAVALPAGRVEFRGQVPPEVAVRYLRASDALLVSLSNDPALASFVPSKLYDFSAVGRPVIVSAAGEPEQLVSREGSAIVVPPGNPHALAEAVRRLRDDVSLRDRLADAGRVFGARNQRDVQVERLNSILQQVAAHGRTT